MKKMGMCLAFLVAAAVTLYILSGGPAVSASVPTVLTADGELLFATNAVDAEPAPARRCFCKCTADDNPACSAGQQFECPFGNNCSTLNGDGCSVNGKNGTLSDCRKGPVPIEAFLLN